MRSFVRSEHVITCFPCFLVMIVSFKSVFVYGLLLFSSCKLLLSFRTFFRLLFSRIVSFVLLIVRHFRCVLYFVSFRSYYEHCLPSMS